MPFIVACPVISFLRRSTYTKKLGERAAKQCNEIPPWNFHSIPSSAKESSPAGIARPSALAAMRLITKSNLSGAAGLLTLRQRRLHPQSSDGIARWISSWTFLAPVQGHRTTWEFRPKGDACRTSYLRNHFEPDADLVTYL